MSIDWQAFSALLNPCFLRFVFRGHTLKIVGQKVRVEEKKE